MEQVQPLLSGFKCCSHEEMPCWSSQESWSPAAMPCHAMPCHAMPCHALLCPPWQLSKT